MSGFSLFRGSWEGVDHGLFGRLGQLRAREGRGSRIEQAAYDLGLDRLKRWKPIFESLQGGPCERILIVVQCLRNRRTVQAQKLS
jgi:hypothetical protein